MKAAIEEKHVFGRDNTSSLSKKARTTPRIVHVTTAHEPDDIRIFRKHCVSLRSVFDDVHLVAPCHSSYEDQGVQIHGVIRHRNRLQRFFLTLPRIFRAARRLRADVYHLHDPDLLLVAPLLRSQGARVIFDSHEDYPRDLFSRPYLQNAVGKTVVRAYASFEKRIFRGIDAVVTVNAEMTRRISKVQRNTATVYNFPIAEDLPKPRATPAYPEKVVWLGLLNAARGVANLDAAARRLPEGTIEIIGRCDDIELDTSSLSYLGRMEYKTALERTAEYGAGLATFPSSDFHKDMFPIKLFEYMLMGMPLIASNFPKWLRLVGETGCAIFVDPDDPEEIAKAIEWSIRNPEEARKMGMKGRELALRKYVWGSEANKLIGLYNILLEGRGLGAAKSESLAIDPLQIDPKL